MTFLVTSAGVTAGWVRGLAACGRWFVVFVFWIVDASIFEHRLQWLHMSHHDVWGWRCSVFVVLLFLLSVCETSYEGHMVDALASRADEGRASLR